VTGSEPLTPEQVRELQPLREVIARQFGQPVMPTAEGFSDLADRITVAVAVYMGGVVPQNAAEARALANAMDRQHGTGARLRTATSSCPSCLAVKVDGHRLHTADCALTRPRYGECPQTERHAAHQWTGGLADEVRYWCDGSGS